MTDTPDSDDVSRRTYLKLAGGAGTATFLAGCTGGGGESTTESTESSGDSESTEETSGDDSDSSTEYNALEVQHWWTGGDGGAAVQALFEGFEEQHPDIELTENPVAGGAGQNLRAVIKKRILNNDPPSSWQAWPGANLQPFTDADKLEDIEESVWDHNDMKNTYLDGPQEAAQPAGNYVSVPLNIHRLNNLFYNVEVVEDAGVDPASIDSPSALVDAMATVDEAGYVGMAQQTNSAWSTGQLWAQVLLGEYGADVYADVTAGNVEANADAVRDSLDIVKQYSEYYPNDAGSISWQDANSKIIEGDAAFFHQGDWAAGMYRGQDGFEYESNWDHVPFPGTEGLYSLNMDSFPMPTNNPSPEATKAFLRYVGSVDAQERFNPKKGSIPPRTDVPQDAFGPFLQNQMDDFSNSEAQPLSIQHGLAVAPDALTAFEDAMASFISNYDVEAAYSAVQSAFQ
ncbi:MULTISPECIES: extracellular solute-binding protein [Haloferax]|uniref:ABC-type transport system periplasmic substrate-binding protein (Probable substrate sugar) n=1 Tax=Haloferax gibbonsii TaxID=35746 RepID=A0A0K1IWG0_HALGI|nr:MULTISPECIES: extracellular solute-binding protein [Haloferax]AKU08877.1 sugar ABC transporter substrate-binding protein [Haloferax gibbonsii]QOS11936.1 ABC-type transport system periplasmic substrate-binding protein (probable substrate sugar) [Haloferax gibbonsii]RDZ51985.1 carbohydrate ABC transporter substrate-binding protein [Haloferax sp. Atlit-4N]REA01347.1 carbohydrate ABC transporter substrate-binding protein [Haloferax sp. Atlit-6N]